MDKLLNYLKLNMSQFFEYIKIIDITYTTTTNILVVKVVYKQDFDFSVQKRNELKAEIVKFLNIPNLMIDLKCKKSLLDKTAIVSLVKHFLTTNYQSVFLSVLESDFEINFDSDEINIVCLIQEMFFDYLQTKKFDKELKAFLERNYFQNFKIELKKSENRVDNSSDFEDFIKTFEEENSVDNLKFEPNVFTVEILNEFIGQDFDVNCYASDSIPKNEKNISAAGVVKFLTRKTFMSKRKNTDPQEKEYFSFVLQDNFGKSNCVFFPTKDSAEKIKDLADGDQIVIVGDSEEFNERVNIKVKKIAYCELPEKQEIVVEEKGVNERYKYIFPEEYIDFKQSNLFDVESDNNNKFLKENVCVVFDVETTGLEASTCEIIEIGGVKIVDGKITETFSCLIKPKSSIPSEITKITGITNQMVEGCLGIDKVLQDFHKFSYGCVLVAHNIAFDYKFLYAAGKDQGYKFNNKQIDTLALARANLRGLKNYKLKTITDSLGISLENAHRAVHDAVATAQMFIQIIDSNYVV